MFQVRVERPQPVRPFVTAVFVAVLLVISLSLILMLYQFFSYIYIRMYVYIHLYIFTYMYNIDLQIGGLLLRASVSRQAHELSPCRGPSES